MNDDHKKYFIQGYACAVATLIRAHGPGTEVDDLIRAGLHLEDVKKWVDPFDKEVLLPEIERLKRPLK